MADNRKSSHTSRVPFAHTDDAEVSDWRMQLNNFLQGNGGTKMLTWDVYSAGPSHQVVWTATTYSACVSLPRYATRF